MMRPTSTSPDANTSAVDSKPSATTDAECPRHPAVSFTIASNPLTTIPRIAIRRARCIVDGSSGGHAMTVEQAGHECAALIDQFPRSRPEAHIDSPPLDVGHGKKFGGEPFEI